ncbi:MAG: amine oxidase, flavin-containing [Bacteriovoracaceae bacterium]|nr:amine oxidase, flavin-containing [Bacteriovoracaceae bacterium]
MASKKVIILGAGPCGLGAAWRLKELGLDDFLILEGSDHPGGLASSFVDDKGFTWDIGGHVQFSHYEDFDRVMELALPGGWLHHQRESWVWIYDRFIPYPLQNNIWRLPEDVRARCLEGLENISKNSDRPANFSQWLMQSFGEGLNEVFMKPYNFKVWAYPPEEMSFQWIGERVATVDIKKIKESIRLQKDELSWGPNATFRFPKKGGTGAIWKAVAGLIGEEKISYQKKVQSVDREKKILTLTTGEKYSYDVLLTTIPLDRFFQIAQLKLEAPLLSSHSHIVGIGIKGKVPEHLKSKCWIYFPESETPFYRVTVFSNYSPANVPDSDKFWSLMCETSSSPKKTINEQNVLEETIQGLLKSKLISKTDEIVSKWSMVAKPGYPTPSLDRDLVVSDALSQLKKSDIYSRGRFGAWKYEVSNQDHTFMQGFEWAEWYVKGREELTVFSPALANAPGKREAF